MLFVSLVLYEEHYSLLKKKTLKYNFESTIFTVGYSFSIDRVSSFNTKKSDYTNLRLGEELRVVELSIEAKLGGLTAGLWEYQIVLYWI